MDSLKNKKTELDSLMPLMREQLAAGGTVTFSPHGVSMLPMIRQGKDSVTLSPIKGRLKKYDLPLYMRDNGQYVLHRIIRVGETYDCIGDNQYQIEHGVRHDQLIAVVSSFSRDGRIVKVTSPKYWLYCRFWCLRRSIRMTLRRIFKRKNKYEN